MAANLEQKTGRNMSSWIETALSSGKAKHGEMVAYLKVLYTVDCAISLSV